MDTGIIDPVTVMMDYILQFSTQSAIVHKVIVSLILIPAALSSLFTSYVADLLEQLKCISIDTFIFEIRAAVKVEAVSLTMFVIGKCIESLSEGLYLSTLIV